MLHLTLEPEPDNFDADVRQKGLNYLREHPNAVHYPDYWNKVAQQFRKAYRYINMVLFGVSFLGVFPV